ncbi:hypothetical protein GBF38_001698 [Nibea albiflora]|uniref:Uncharacterized protein n=1 Tax=Nibea albiflora TaxID=240163 RepID=A0ACB7EVC4_NIBAL|nr:hypothetical protein GBF38_001698 [Nibea albiflora]
MAEGWRGCRRRRGADRGDVMLCRLHAAGVRAAKRAESEQKNGNSGADRRSLDIYRRVRVQRGGLCMRTQLLSPSRRMNDVNLRADNGPGITRRSDVK